METIAPRPMVQIRAVPEAAEDAFPHFRQGKSIAEVAELVNRAESTTRDYLYMYIEQERPRTIDSWIDRATQDRVTEAARQHGSQGLKPIFLALNQEVPYDAIRIVLTFLNSRSGE